MDKKESLPCKNLPCPAPYRYRAMWLCALFFVLVGWGGLVNASNATATLLLVGKDKNGVAVSRELSDEYIKHLPGFVIQTTTSWTDGVHTFKGVLVNELFRSAKIVLNDDDQVLASALNGYETVIPAADFLSLEVLLAYEMDGVALPLRGRGPYWIVYPRASSLGFADTRYDDRWIWQLRSLEIL